AAPGGVGGRRRVAGRVVAVVTLLGAEGSRRVPSIVLPPVRDRVGRRRGRAGQGSRGRDAAPARLAGRGPPDPAAPGGGASHGAGHRSAGGVRGAAPADV